jgi:hypothetical protein
MAESIKNTIGINFETIIFDNREKKLDICQVYNYCAAKAKFPYLCFIHEDIIMPTVNWGKNMIEFAEKTPECGIIGFAGGTIVKKNFLSWWCGTKARYRFYDLNIGGKACHIDGLSCKYNNPDNEEFAKVITLDGVFLFLSKDVWKDNPFDEERIKGFHFYNADFSFGIAQKKQNYVCLTADIYHFSVGSHDKTYDENARIFQKKWKQALPYSISNQKAGIIDEIDTALILFIHSIRHGVTIKDSVKHFLEINGLFSIFVILTLLPLKMGFIRN